MAKNVTLGKNYPPMPKPEDFGIIDYNWVGAKIFGPYSLSAAKIEAYERALQAWKEAVRDIPADQADDDD